MSQRYLGGVITANPTTPTTASASGVWTLEQQFQYLQGVTPKKIGNSVRLRTSAGGYLSRTPSSSGSTTQWTLSTWVKRGTLGTFTTIFSACITGNPYYQSVLAFDSSDRLWYYQFSNSSVYTVNVTSTAVFRDPSAWYHVVMKFDANTSSMILWVNNQQVISSSSFSTTYRYINTTNTHYIGNYAYQSVGPGVYDGYLAEFNFIDGQALTPSSFGAFDGNGVWQPLNYTGSYGTNGFFLSFADTTSTTTIGYDTSGNGNNWTANNISLTSGVTYDAMIDSPTTYADGGNGRGNYSVLNYLNNTGTLSNANLTFTGTDKAVLSTIAIPASGKYYFEATCTTVANFSTIGIANSSSQASSFNGVIASANFRTYNSGGEKADSTRTAGWGSTFTSGDVIGVAVDMDNGAIYFAKNNTWQASGVPTSGASKTGAAFTDLTSSGITWTAFFSAQNSSGVWNPAFGQRPFAYTPPTGFVALNTQNLTPVTINNGAQYMAATTYTGNGSTQSISNGGNNPIGTTFQPDLVWAKTRVAVSSNALFDSVRGATKVLVSNSTVAETNLATNGVTAFNSNGFSVTDDSAGNYYVNGASGGTYSGTPPNYVAWNWKAAGSSVSNTNGSITSTVNAGTTQGFSVVTYTGTGALGTVGHGLGVAPKMILIKSRSQAANWTVYHASVGNTGALFLNLTNATDTGSAYWNNTSPTSSVFTINLGSASNTSGQTYVAYCFAQVAGYSAFGSYTGNGSSDGPFVYLGFRPRYVMLKVSSTTGDWVVYDTSRNTYNVVDLYLYPNSSAAEGGSGTPRLDILSNGFKLRQSGQDNTSGATYIYAAFAENPFTISRAR